MARRGGSDAAAARGSVGGLGEHDPQDREPADGAYDRGASQGRQRPQSSSERAALGHRDGEPDGTAATRRAGALRLRTARGGRTSGPDDPAEPTRSLARDPPAGRGGGSRWGGLAVPG